jgi:putative transposase
MKVLKVSRSREGKSDSKVFEKYRRRQRKIDLVLLEAFLLGQSTRNTIRHFKGLFEESMSAQTESSIVRELDSDVRPYHRCRFGRSYDCVYLDGFRITLSGSVKVKKVVLVALGMRPDGTKDLLSLPTRPG